MSEPYADVPPGFYVREDADYGEVLVPVTAAGVPATDDSGRELPGWSGTVLESCIRDVALGRIASHSSVTDEMVADWRRLNPARPGTADPTEPPATAEQLRDLIRENQRLRAVEQRVRDALAPFEELFAGGPDTACRTTWRVYPTRDLGVPDEECVEVPMADLRDAFDRAHRALGGGDDA